MSRSASPICGNTRSASVSRRSLVAPNCGGTDSAGKLWVNPDCGLKTRGWPATEAVLANMVTAARRLRVRPDDVAAAA